MDYAVIYSILTRLQAEQKVLESQILRTETGPNREYLTDVNIHVLEAIDNLKKVDLVPLRLQK